MKCQRLFSAMHLICAASTYLRTVLRELITEIDTIHVTEYRYRLSRCQVGNECSKKGNCSEIVGSVPPLCLPIAAYSTYPGMYPPPDKLPPDNAHAASNA